MPTLQPIQSSTTPIPTHLTEPPVTAADRLRSIFDNPGPYTSVYLQTRPLLHDPCGDLERRWQRIRLDLDAGGASRDVLDAIEARLRLPRPEDTSAIGIIAAANANTIVDHALEPPRVDCGRIDTLPYVAPLLEWEQRRIPHIVVSVDESGADVVVFGIDHRTAIFSTARIGGMAELVFDIAEHVASIDARLVVIAGDRARRHELAEMLVTVVAPRCRIVTDDSAGADELAQATVRHVNDAAARATVELLREHRYLASHDSTVEGAAAAIEALTSRRSDVLLIHDDPDDDRRVWIGDDPIELSIDPRRGLHSQARLVDAAIRSAIAQDAQVHIIPTTGSNGPEDNVAVLTRKA